MLELRYATKFSSVAVVMTVHIILLAAADGEMIFNYIIV